MTELVNKAFKVRLYPTPEQQTLLSKMFGCARWVYNHFLERRTEAYKTDGCCIGYNECSEELTRLKVSPDTRWLREADKFALQNSLRDLDAAFVNFFEGRAVYPKFKSKRALKQSYRTNYTNGNICIDKKRGFLKLPKVGWVKYAVDGRDIPENILNVTVTKTSSSKYFASVLCKVAIEPLSLAENEVGVDLGLKKFAILSTGETVENPKYYVRAQKKLVRLQRALSRKKKGSKNYEKARLKLSRQHEKVANQRRDFQHKLSKRLVVENQVISMEDLRVKNMVKNRKLAKAISDAGWGEFQRMVEYKSAWYGRTFVKVNPFFPSSRLCSKCGNINPMLTLSDREWQCPVCGAVHDRDVNAADNILAEGKRLLAS
jgi:putative transposase